MIHRPPEAWWLWPIAAVDTGDESGVKHVKGFWRRSPGKSRESCSVPQGSQEFDPIYQKTSKFCGWQTITGFSPVNVINWFNPHSASEFIPNVSFSWLKIHFDRVDEARNKMSRSRSTSKEASDCCCTGRHEWKREEKVERQIVEVPISPAAWNDSKEKRKVSFFRINYRCVFSLRLTCCSDLEAFNSGLQRKTNKNLKCQSVPWQQLHIISNYRVPLKSLLTDAKLHQKSGCFVWRYVRSLIHSFIHSESQMFIAGGAHPADNKGPLSGWNISIAC